MYVYGDEYFEVSFPIDHFLHLTGVETRLSAKDFYKNAKKSILTNNQFYFDARHVYANAKKKFPCLKRLPELTNEMVCVLKDMETMTITYKLSVTNLEFTLGLTENIDNNGNKINDLFLHYLAKSVVGEKKKRMPGKSINQRKTRQYRAYQNREKFMIRVLFICHCNV